VKTRCPPVENVNETPDSVGVEILEVIHATETELYGPLV